MSLMMILLLTSLVYPKIPSTTRGRVESEIKRINSMREGLVSGVQPPVHKDTFKAVCGPVGMSLKKLADKQGWLIRQASHKYRNPQHKANQSELAAIEVFQKSSQKKAFWQNTAEGSYYFQRIDIQPASLSCHGSKEARPEFVKKDYPQDQAFDFKVGDLRGIYSVFVASPENAEKKKN